MNVRMMGSTEVVSAPLSEKMDSIEATHGPKHVLPTKRMEIYYLVPPLKNAPKVKKKDCSSGPSRENSRFSMAFQQALKAKLDKGARVAKYIFLYVELSKVK